MIERKLILHPDGPLPAKSWPYAVIDTMDYMNIVARFQRQEDAQLFILANLSAATYQRERTKRPDRDEFGDNETHD